MKQQIIDRATDISYLASAATTATGVLTWLNSNAQAIGALCAIGGLLVAIATFFVNWFYRHRDRKRD